MSNNSYILLTTLVATLGGLLFGYDTAVISGTINALSNFFVQPLYNDGTAALNVIVQYKMMVTLLAATIAFLLCSFIFKLFSKSKASIYSLLIVVIGVVIWYTQFWHQANELTETMANAINGFAVSSAQAGCIIGGAIAGFVSTKIGRKNGMTLSAILFLISAIGSALPDTLNLFHIETLSSFIFYRVIGGIGVGISSMIVPMYIAEIAPAEIRGKLVSWNQFALIFGMLVVYFVNFIIAKQGDASWLNDIGWRWMFSSEVIPAVLFFVLLFTIPETPRYLVMEGKNDQAQKVLNKFVSEERAPSVLEEIKNSLKEKSAHWMSFGGLVIMVGIGLSLFQQFVGINVVLYYAPEIFRNMGSGNDSSLLQTIIVGAVNLAFTLIAVFTVDKLGRKPLLILGAAGMCISMTALGFLFYFNQMGIAALLFMLIYVASFAISWGPVCWVMLAEIFPNSIRGAMAIAVAAQWVANMTVAWTFPMLNNSTVLNNLFHHGFTYWMYGAMGILAILFMWKWVPETKGKTLEEIEHIWKPKHNS